MTLARPEIIKMQNALSGADLPSGPPRSPGGERGLAARARGRSRANLHTPLAERRGRGLPGLDDPARSVGGTGLRSAGPRGGAGRGGAALGGNGGPAPGARTRINRLEVGNLPVSWGYGTEGYGQR